MPSLSMLNTGKQVHQFFDTYEVWNPQTNQHEKRYRLKSIEQYSREHNTNEQPGKQYFKATSLPELINTAPLPQSKSGRSTHELEKGELLFSFSKRAIKSKPTTEMNNRAAFIDFCQGLLNLNPVTRWTPQQARMHPFITGEKFTKPFVVSEHLAHILCRNLNKSRSPMDLTHPLLPRLDRTRRDLMAVWSHRSQKVQERIRMPQVTTITLHSIKRILLKLKLHRRRLLCTGIRTLRHKVKTLQQRHHRIQCLRITERPPIRRNNMHSILRTNLPRNTGWLSSSPRQVNSIWATRFIRAIRL